MDKDEIIIVPKKEEYVSVEKNKKRQNKRRLRGFIRFISLVVLFLLLFLGIKYFPQIKEKAIAIFDGIGSSTNKPSVNENEGIKNEGLQSGNDEGTNSDINNSSGEKEDINFPSDSYRILDTGSQKYTLTNESGCELDLNKKPTITKASEIYKKYGNEAPLVLITSTHLRESYSNGKYYTTSDNFYSDSKNVGELGKIIAEVLNSKGINTILLSELYASGSIINSRDEYEKSLNDTLKKYPSISYVFDISRGIYIKDDMTMNKYTCTYNGQSCAQISLINGTNSSSVGDELYENILFALDFYDFSFEKSPCLVLENKISRFPLSQNIAPFVCEVEIGTYANSFEEARLGAESFAYTFSQYLFSKE